MKKLSIILAFLILSNPVWAECPVNKSCNSTKCTDLMSSMYDNHATLYNVLNLSCDQQKCKDTIDKKYLQEAGDLFEKYEQEKFVLNNMKKHSAGNSALKKQKRVVRQVEKSLQGLNDKYDKEFKLILNSEQKSKLNTIRKMEKRELNYCRKNKALYKRDKNLRPFGEKMYYTDSERVLCPVHKKWHFFGFKHKVKK